jgi:hypothetical protein
VGEVVLRDDHDARRAAVEAVDDPRAQLAPDAGEVAAAVEQRVHERAARVARRRVDDEARGLVDDDHVRVLEEHGERDRLGRHGEGRGLGRLLCFFNFYSSKISH